MRDSWVLLKPTWGIWCNHYRTSTPIPAHDPYFRPGLLLVVELDEYIKQAAAVQAEPGLPRGFTVTNDEYVTIPDGLLKYPTDAEGIQKMFAAKQAT